MVDDMINRLENMSLTTEEEEVITISDKGRKEEIESCSLSLIGKFLTCKPFNKRAAQNTLRRAWSLEKGVQMMEVGSNLFQFKFCREFDLDKVYKEGLWSFDNQVLMLRRWQPGMTVAVPIAKPLRCGGFIGGSDGQRSWVSYKYERLPLFCHFCGLLGHDTKHCAKYYARSKNGSEVICQYGEWLKSAGGQTRSPVRRGVNMNNSNRDDNQVGEGNLESTAAEEANVQGNPSAPNSYVNGKGGDSGNFPAFTDNAAVTEGGIMEGHGLIDTGINEGALNSSRESSLNVLELNHMGLLSNAPDVMHVTPKTHDGPQGLKQKPTWTRLVRMECGPSVGKQESCKQKLRKRGGVSSELFDTRKSRVSPISGMPIEPGGNFPLHLGFLHL
ncbi:hypothetical protein CFP56_038961 [Quercus suber]|uniref:DUF4283 domain-containing protein n=1 Tax=Quercus suber TaxID=58331 RepID=A0AAW0J1I9_QUESU